VKLFERHGRRLNLTREGQMLYDLARPLVDGLDALEGEFHSRLKGLEGGELNIAAGASTILYLLPPLIRAFRESHPDVQLKLHNVTGKDGLALIRSDEVDLAVGSMLDVPTDIDYAPLYSFEPMLITPPDHPLANRSPIALQDLSPYGLILPPRRLTTYRLVDLIFQQQKVPYTVALEVGGWEVIKQYVAMGLGISIVTGICIEPSDHQRLAVRDMSAYFPPRSYGVVIRKGKYLSPQARAFVDQVKPAAFGRGYDEAGHSER
jgi:DNA-binding transcriptional LysR family regulator